MKYILSVRLISSASIAAVALMTANLPSQAQNRPVDNEGRGLAMNTSKAVTTPMKMIYRVAGFYDTGGGDYSGVASVVQCNSFSNAAEQIRFVVRGDSTFNKVYPIEPMGTFVITTHNTNWMILVDAKMNIGFIQGALTIAASSTNIICNAMMIDASAEPLGGGLAAALGTGVALHMVRYNPIPGTQE